jgi:hypothetical protein
VGYKNLSPLLKRTVVEEFRRDPRPCAIAARLGLHHATVKRWLAEAGITPDPGASFEDRWLSAQRSLEEAEALERRRRGIPDGKAPLHDEEWFRTASLEEMSLEVRRLLLGVMLRPGGVEDCSPADAAAILKDFLEIEKKKLGVQS